MKTTTAARASWHRRLGMLAGAAALLATAVLVPGTLSASAATHGSPVSNAPACVAPERPLSRGYDAATRHDREFNRNFRHCFTTINGVQMHYVIGGHGPHTMVLLHGWPQSWYEFHGVMPKLLAGRTIVAIDLPGTGDTTGNPPSMEKNVLADYVHALLDRVGMQRNVQLVAHDLGVGVGYALAAQYRQQAAGLFAIDFPLTGKTLTYTANVMPVSFHFSFNLQEPLAEQLVTGRVETFLTYFYPLVSHVPNPIPANDVAEYVRVYSRPQVLHNGFELYRTWPKDDANNATLMQTPLTIPVRLLAQSGFADIELAAIRDAAPTATGTDAPGAGHWLLEERPALVLSEINSFYPTP
jgi:pimeloyl-ACP methyl ester carboxylesterase